MKKNCFNFKKAMTATMMLLSVSMTMTSCQEFWDDLFGPNDTPTETPTEPEDDGSVTLTSTGATIKVEKVSDITELLNQIKSDIASKVGQEYVVEIISEGLKATSDDNTVSVPKVEKSNINLTFANGITTEVPLVVKAAETASTTSTEAVNTLTITMPESTGLSLELNMPETGTTLNAASGSVVYNEVIATIATTDSYINNGITVKELQVKDGIVTIKDGGKAETYVYAATENTNTLQIHGNNQKDGYAYLVIHNNQGTDICHVLTESNMYEFNSLKILKGIADYAVVESHRWAPIGKLILAEGNITKFGGALHAKKIEGEGNGAELISNAYFFGEGENGKNVINFVCSFDFVEEIKNVSISTEAGTEEAQKVLSEADIVWIRAEEVPGYLENCTFKFDQIQFKRGTTTTNSVKNCTFNKTGYHEDRYQGQQISIMAPIQTSETPSYTFSFTNCTFDKTFYAYVSVENGDYEYDENGDRIISREYYYYYDSDNMYHEVESVNDIPEGVEYHGPVTIYKRAEITYSDYDVTLSIKNCKFGENALTNTSGFVVGHMTEPGEGSDVLPTGVNLQIEIDGTTYGDAYWDSDAGQWMLPEKP